MPFRSEKQRRFLWLKHPDIAKRWTREYGSKPVGKKKDKEAQDAMNFPERVVNTMQIAAAALQKAETEQQEKQAAEVKYAQAIPAAVAACVRFGRIDDTPDEREKLAAWLTTPQGALEVVQKLAEHEVEAPSASLGQSVDANGRPTRTKKASASSDYIGGRRSADKPESWSKLESGLGLAV